MKSLKTSHNPSKTPLLCFVALFLLSIFSLYAFQYNLAKAAIAQKARVSFTFDDGPLSNYTQALPTLNKHGIKGTAYISTNCIESVGTCPADTQSTYMNWSQVLALQNSYDWEIGAHTADHTPTSAISNSQLINQINQSNQAFASKGLNPKAFASPEGDYSPSSLATIAKYYTSHRGFHDTGYNNYPYNDYILRVQQVQVGVSVSQVKSYINTAKANGHWLILVFHEIQPTPHPDPQEYEYSTADLDAIASYVKQQNVETTKITEGLISSQNNLLPNSSFNNGLNNGWATDDSSKITPNATNNGSAPSSTNSIAISSSSSKNTHLFSPKTKINWNDTYIVKQYLKINTRSSGDVSFYIDEYDVNDNWISGQYKGSISWLFPENKNYTYTPSSVDVEKIRIQVIVSSNSGINGHVDNVELFSSTNTPINHNPDLLVNGKFDQGISSGWSTDNPNNVFSDTNNNGAPGNAQNSIKMTSSNRNNHLFSPKVSVSSANNYTINTYRNISLIGTGELGYYIDEYDANGNWISGKYITSFYSLGANDYQIAYTPTSTSVKTASLQVFVTSNSNIVAYIDDVSWYQL